MPTQRVRIFGYIDPQGQWAAQAWGGNVDGEQPDEMYELQFCRDMMPPDSDRSKWQRFTLEADVPIPDDVPVVVEGTVVE